MLCFEGDEQALMAADGGYLPSRTNGLERLLNS